MGRPNAAVFPLPVSAKAIISRPDSAYGKTSLWIAVGDLQLSAETAAHSSGHKPKEEKVVAGDAVASEEVEDGEGKRSFVGAPVCLVERMGRDGDEGFSEDERD